MAKYKVINPKGFRIGSTLVPAGEYIEATVILKGAQGMRNGSPIPSDDTIMAVGKDGKKYGIGVLDVKKELDMSGYSASQSEKEWQKQSEEVFKPLTDKLNKGVRTVQIMGFVGLAAGLGFAYYRKSKWYGYLGWGALGSTLLTVGSGAFLLKRGVGKVKGTVEEMAKDATQANQQTSTLSGDLAYNNMKSVLTKMGMAKDVPAKEMFLARYGKYSPQEKKIFSSYITEMNRVDFADHDKAIESIGKVQQKYIDQHGKDFMQKLLS